MNIKNVLKKGLKVVFPLATYAIERWKEIEDEYDDDFDDWNWDLDCDEIIELEDGTLVKTTYADYEVIDENKES